MILTIYLINILPKPTGSVIEPSLDNFRKHRIYFEIVNSIYILTCIYTYI